MTTLDYKELCIEDLKTTVTSQQGQIKWLKSLIDLKDQSAKAELDSLRCRINEQSSELKDAYKELDTLRSQSHSFDKQLKEFLECRENFAAQAEHLLFQINDLQKDLQNKTAQCEEQEKDLETLKLELNYNKKAVAVLTKSNHDKDNQIEELIAKNDNLKATTPVSTEELVAAIQRHEQKFERLQSRVAELEIKQTSQPTRE